MRVNVIGQWFLQRKKTQFGYMKDRLFWIAVFIYLLNRLILEPVMAGRTDFFSSYVNDIICFPFWLPIVLYLTRLVRLRRHDLPPDFFELCFYFLIWSYIFEFVGPMYGSRFNYHVSDPWDIVCYASGCLFAGLYWNFRLFPAFR